MRPNDRGPRSGEAGFSLIEGLIAALLLLVIILGVLPLVSRAMFNNLQGNDASQETNASIDGLEELLSIPLTADPLTLVAGETSKVLEDVFSSRTNSWAPGNAPDVTDAQKQLVRTATVEWFGLADLDQESESGLTVENTTFGDPLDGGVGNGGVAFRRITMTIDNERRWSALAPMFSYRVVAVQTY